MVVLRYEGAPGTDWTALVGKGLMFDAGGYHLKTIDGMNGMKYDMCGAAGVLEILEYLVTQRIEKNVMAVLMQDYGFITGQPDTSTVAMRRSIWGRCTCIPLTIKEWQKQQNCSV